MSKKIAQNLSTYKQLISNLSNLVKLRKLAYKFVFVSVIFEEYKKNNKEII